MKKPSTLTRSRNGNVRNGQLTIGLDVGDRSSFYCVLNERGEVILEARVATTPVQSLTTTGVRRLTLKRRCEFATRQRPED
jgi:predicted NBD/HSP70 family sugar kinase